MQEQDKNALISNNPTETSAIDPHHHRRRALTQATPSITDSIADALVMKNDNIFFLS